jgi:hypothetical protein
MRGFACFQIGYLLYGVDEPLRAQAYVESASPFSKNANLGPGNIAILKVRGARILSGISTEKSRYFQSVGTVWTTASRML